MTEKTYGMSMYASKEDRDLDIMRDAEKKRLGIEIDPLNKVNDRRHGLAPRDFGIINTDELATLRDKAAAFDWVCANDHEYKMGVLYVEETLKQYEGSFLDCINQAMKDNNSKRG